MINYGALAESASVILTIYFIIAGIIIYLLDKTVSLNILGINLYYILSYDHILLKA